MNSSHATVIFLAEKRWSLLQPPGGQNMQKRALVLQYTKSHGLHEASLTWVGCRGGCFKYSSVKICRMTKKRFLGTSHFENKSTRLHQKPLIVMVKNKRRGQMQCKQQKVAETV